MDYQMLIDQLYDEQEKIKTAEFEKQLDEKLEQYNNEQIQIEQQYKPYIDGVEYERFRAESALGEKLANDGQKNSQDGTLSGIGKQETLMLNTAYSGELFNALQNKQNDLAEVQQDINNAKSDTENEIGAALSKIEADRIEATLEESQRQWEINREDEIIQQQNEREDRLIAEERAYNDKVREQEYENEADNGQTSEGGGSFEITFEEGWNRMIESQNPAKWLVDYAKVLTPDVYMDLYRALQAYNETFEL